MKKVNIQAFEDRSRAEGGHAAILLQGLARPQGMLVFRVRPVDAHRSGEKPGGWIGGEHAPVSVNETDQGLEIVAGPSVTESEHLLPGTVVEIEIPACAARGEFLWPNIAPLMRPKRKNIVVNRHRGNVKPDPVMALPPELVVVAAKALAFSTRSEAQTAPADATIPQDPVAASIEESAATAETPVISPAVANIETVTAETSSVSVNEAPMKLKWPDEARMGPRDPETTTEEIAEKFGWAFRKDVSSMLSKKFFALGASRHDDLQDEAVHAAGDSTHHNIAAEATAILAHMEESEAMDSRPEFYAAPLHEDSQRHPVETAYPSGGSDTFYTHARGSIASTPVRDRRGPSLRSAPRAPISAGAVAGLASLAIGGIAAFVLLSGRASVSGNDAGAVSLSAATQAIAAPATSATGSVQPANTLLFDALSVGATSPRGTSANGVTAARALENANVQLLASGAARDTDEGAFWLKQYITGTLADDRTMRVLTQLGSVYAEPSMGTPDYAKARLLWEISSAAGDPVAMCFLGLLHESGLGVTADRTSALRWYERSKDKGGCPNVHESLARVRQ